MAKQLNDQIAKSPNLWPKGGGRCKGQTCMDHTQGTKAPLYGSDWNFGRGQWPRPSPAL
uniref:Uncharacterized protein n=1 Tax=Rhizophagus irregularis (strain DAOM 181602 / DAOM 197198 / MUCL 43194) TaxID=747089 RepID=U9TS04_RHIID